MDDISTVAPLYLRVDSIAANVPPTHVVRHLCRLADRIGILVCCSVNGIEVSVYPETNEYVMADRYEEAQRRQVSWVSSNAIPAGS